VREPKQSPSIKLFFVVKEIASPVEQARNDSCVREDEWEVFLCSRVLYKDYYNTKHYNTIALRRIEEQGVEKGEILPNANTPARF